MKKLIDSLPLLSVSLTIIAATYTYSYYKVIGLNIFNYLEITEVILLQFKLLAQVSILVIFSLFSIIIYFAATAHTFAPNDVEAELNTKNTENWEDKVRIANNAARENTTDWISNPPVPLKAIIVFTILAWLLYFFFLLFSPLTFPFFKTVGSIGILVIFAGLFNKYVSKGFYKLYRGKYYSNRNLANEISKVMKQLIFVELVSAVVLFTIMIGEYDIYDALLNESPRSAKIHLEDKVISTNDTTIYLGRTKGFLFLFNKTREETIIIPADKVTQLDLSPGKKSVIFPKSYLNPHYFRSPIFTKKENK